MNEALDIENNIYREQESERVLEAKMLRFSLIWLLVFCSVLDSSSARPG